jgi:hypothetical protein
MLENQEAVSLFTSTIDSFYNKVYNEIANYVVDYVSNRHSPVEVSVLIGDIANSGIADAEELESKVGEIVGDNYHPPYSVEAMTGCARAIKEEKDKLYDKSLTDKSFGGKSDTEKARIIHEYAQRKLLRIKKSKAN